MTGIILNTALEAHGAKLRVLPSRQDGSKAPINVRDGSWKPAQSERESIEDIHGWYGDHQGFGYVCGAISGNLELFDFDDRQTYETFCEVGRGGGSWRTN